MIVICHQYCILYSCFFFFLLCPKISLDFPEGHLIHDSGLFIDHSSQQKKNNKNNIYHVLLFLGLFTFKSVCVECILIFYQTKSPHLQNVFRFTCKVKNRAIDFSRLLFITCFWRPQTAGHARAYSFYNLEETEPDVNVRTSVEGQMS